MTNVGFYGENTALGHLGGDDGLPVVGNTFNYFKDAYAFGEGLRERFGEIYRTRAFFMSFVVFSSPDAAGYVLQDEDKNFSSKLGWGPFLDRVLPGGLTTRDFEDHRKQRRIMQDVFKPSAMAGYSDIIQDTVVRGLATWDTKDIVYAYPAIKSIQIELAARAFCGLDLKDDIEFLTETFFTILEGVTPFIPFAVPPFALWKGMRARDRFIEYFRKLIPERRAGNGSDIFSRLCQARDEDGQAFTDDAVLHHLLTVIAASHNASTLSMTGALDYLTRDPAWLRTVRDRSLEVGAGHVAYEDVARLTEHEWVYREALRFFPALPQIARRALRDCEYNGVRIPAGTQIMVDAGVIQRSERYWKDAATFDPGRYSPERAEHKEHKYKWIPFGSGAHVCIGMQFALIGARVMLHHLLTRFDIERVNQLETRYSILPVTSPKDGLPIRVKLRP